MAEPVSTPGPSREGRREAITERLAAVRARIAEAAREAGRDPAEVKLIAVSKTFDAPDIEPVLDAGHRVFGENRVQEAQKKWPALRIAHPDIELHLIGPLQSNKAADAVALFDAIQTVDRQKIAVAIAAAMAAQGRRPRLFVQVNTGAEPQKAGIAPEETVAFVRHCREALQLAIDGLMCIPPVDDMASVHFAFLAKLAREAEVENLSMGMSADYAAAVSLGATHVRVGSAIFGAR
jgi:pyridoxal phosphate enzyme (YggS family)